MRPVGLTSVTFRQMSVDEIIALARDCLLYTSLAVRHVMHTPAFHVPAVLDT